MFQIIVIVVATFIISIQGNNNNTTDRLRKERTIATEIGTHITKAPFAAQIVHTPHAKKPGYCTAIIISPRFLLSAGHCLEVPTCNKGECVIYTGSNRVPSDSSYPVQKHAIAKVYRHPKYFFFKDIDIPPLNDIAIIKLEKPIFFDQYRQPIPLVTSQFFPEVGTAVRLFGYGDRWANDNVYPRPLKTVDQVVTSFSACQKAYPESENITHFLCTVGKFGESSCTGDSGGPLVIDGKLAGIVSFGVGDWCSTAYGPNVETRIDLQYPWILETMGDEYVFVEQKLASRYSTFPSNTTTVCLIPKLI